MRNLVIVAAVLALWTLSAIAQQSSPGGHNVRTGT